MRPDANYPASPLEGVAKHLPRLERISDYVRFHALSDPAREAAWEAGRSFSYGELDSAVDLAARRLIAAGVRKGDRVAMMTAPSVDFYEVFLAAVSIGAIWMGLNPRHTRAEIKYIVSDAAPVLILVPEGMVGHDAMSLLQELSRVVISGDSGSRHGRAYWQNLAVADDTSLASARSAVASSDAALLVYTSGSSGRPKGALLPHRGLVAAACTRAEAWWHGPFRTLANLPVNHIGGVGDIVCTTLVSGGMCAFMDRFDAGQSLELVERLRLTFLYQIPTQYQMMFAADGASARDLSSLKAVIWSGSRAPRPLIETLAARFPAMLGTDYSMTETIGAVTLTPLGSDIDMLASSAGWPNPDREIALASDGEIRVRDDKIMLGYLDRPNDSAAAIDAKGWFSTGDIGEFRPDGTIAIVGRKSEMFKSGGYNIYPKEIELVLEGHPAIDTAAVIAVPDPLFHEVGHAFVVVRKDENADAGSLLLWCGKHLANYKIPKAIVFVESLPLLPIGKVDKAQLRQSVEGKK